jgi:hypothetical protein
MDGEAEGLDTWRHRIPCGECKKHWQQILASTPLDFTATEALGGT